MPDDVALIRDLLAARSRHIRDKDAEAALRSFAPDVVSFDLAPPLAFRGPEATDPSELNGWFATWDGPVGVQYDLIALNVSGDIAFAYGFVHLTGRRTDGSHTDVWARFTTCLERRSGEWTIVHQHESFPTMMDGSGLSASNLKP